MTLHIEPNVSFPRGDYRRIQFKIVGEDGNDYDLTGADIEWEIEDTRTRDNVLSLDDNGVDIINRDNSVGKFEVELETNATEDLRSTDYREVLKVIDGDGNRTTWVGDRSLVLTEDG